jgi:large subunit ribosomal protein L15
MDLSTLQRSSGLKDKMRRIGRGNASKGNYSGKGLKGQKARSGKGSKIPAYFEGGQTPLYMRLPKLKGFKRYYKLAKTVETVNIRDLDRAYNNGDIISNASLFQKGLIRNSKNTVKILGNGETKKKFQFEGIELFSKSAESIK